MARGVSRPLPGLGGEGGPLGEKCPAGSRRGAQAMDRLVFDSTGVGAGQAHAAPEIGSAGLREPGDALRDEGDVTPIREPEGSSESLVEGPTSVALQPHGDPLILEMPARGEVPVMEAEAIDHQPAQERVETTEEGPDRDG